MDKQELTDKFETILTETFGVPEGDFSTDATFEALGLDSLDVVELTMVIEEELGVKIEDEELEEIKTVQDALDKVAAKQGS